MFEFSSYFCFILVTPIVVSTTISITFMCIVNSAKLSINNNNKAKFILVAIKVIGMCKGSERNASDD